MKVRSGFVSNSSSSSFILALKRGHEVKELLDEIPEPVSMFAHPIIAFFEYQRMYPSMQEAMEEDTYFYYDERDEEDLASWRNKALGLIEGEDEGDWEFSFGSASNENLYWEEGIGESIICYTSGEYKEGPVRFWLSGDF